jgi:Domain of unknown function (DUF4389)
VQLDIDYPDVRRDLNRWLPLVKWFLAIPHYIVLFFLYIAAVVVVLIAWFAILFTGRYPRGLFDFVEGVSGGTLGWWGTRSCSLPTDIPLSDSLHNGDTEQRPCQLLRFR